MVAKAGTRPVGEGRACVYSRVSNPTDLRDASLESQERATIAFLRGLGYTVDPEDVFRERESGKDNVRPVLARIKGLMREGRYVAIGFYCLDRLVRSQVHCAILFDELEELGVTPHSATNDIGDNSPEGRLILAIRAYLGEAERIKIGERNARCKAEYRERGQFVKLGATTLGYTWDRKERRRRAVPEEAAVVLEVFRRSAAGESNNAIAKHLTAAGVACASVRRGRRAWAAWTSTILRDIIKNPAYKGWTVSDRYRSETKVDRLSGRKRRTIVRRPPEEWFVLDRDGVITEAIVPAPLWEEANRRMAGRIHNRAAAASPPAAAREHLLRGIACCGTCGRRLYHHRSGTRHLYYFCASRHTVFRRHNPGLVPCGAREIPAQSLDAAAWEAFRDVVLTPALLERAVRQLEAQADVAGIQRELDAARRVVAAKQRLRDTLYAKWRAEVQSAADPDFADHLEADYRALKPEVDALRAAAAAIEQRLVAVRPSPATVAEFQARFAALKDRLLVADDTTWAERWEFLRLGGARVVATPDRFDLYCDVFGTGVAKPTETSRGFHQFRNMPLVASA